MRQQKDASERPCTTSLPITLKRLDGLSTAAARQYTTKNWWTEEEELKQVAKLAALNCISTYNPARGSFDTYCYTAMLNDISDFVMCQSSPVSDKRHLRTHLIGTTRIQIDVVDFENLDDYQITMTPDEVLLKKELITLVQKEVVKCVKRHRETIMTPLLAVLLRENTPLEVASLHNLDLLVLHHALRAIRRKLKLNPMLRFLCT